MAAIFGGKLIIWEYIEKDINQKIDKYDVALSISSWALAATMNALYGLAIYPLLINMNGAVTKLMIL